MAENKKSFLMYSDFGNMFYELTDEEAGKLIKHLFRYVNDENPVMEDRLLKIVFEPIKSQLKRDLKQWEETIGLRSENGAMGNLKRWHNDLYLKVTSNEMSLADAIEQSKSRKVSPPDRPRSLSVANVAVNDTVNVNDINISFGEFWDLYDKKVGDKGKLEKKWNSLKDIDRENIISYIPSYKLSQPNKKYRKDPSTFLNNKSWLDEIISDEGVSSKKEDTVPYEKIDATEF